MNKEDIISYVMKTPNNTNPAVLSNMLDSIEGGGGTGDRIVIYEGEITTTETYSSMAGMAYSGAIPSKVMLGYNVTRVYLTIDGEEYALDKSSVNIDSTRGDWLYGTDKRNGNFPRFEEGDCPGAISRKDGYYGESDSLFTGEAKTYTVKIEV